MRTISLRRPALLFVSAVLLLLVLAVLPQTRQGIREFYSWVTGGWYLSDYAPTDYRLSMQTPIILPDGNSEEESELHLVSLWLGKGWSESLSTLEALQQKYPNNLKIGALYVTNESYRISIEAIESVDNPRTRDSNSERAKARLAKGNPLRRKLIEAAARYEKLDPGNSLFALVQSLACEGLREYDNAAVLMKRSSQMPRFQDYQEELIDKFLDAVGKRHGENTYRRFSWQVGGASGFISELGRLGSRWRRDNTQAGLAKRADLIRVFANIFLASHSLVEMSFAHRSITRTAAGDISVLALGRRLNDGDYVRKAIAFENALKSNQMAVPIDLAAFICSRPERGGGWEARRDAVDEWATEVDGFPYRYPEAVNLGAAVIYGFLALATILIVVTLVGLLLGNLIPSFAMPSFAAGSFGVTLALFLRPGQEGAPWVWTIALAYLLLTGLAFRPTNAKYVAVIGLLLAAVSGITALVFELSSGLSAGEMMAPGLVYAVSYARQFWLSKTGPSKSWLFPAIALALLSVLPTAFGYGTPTLTEFCVAVATSSGIVLVVVACWQAVTFREASKQILRAAPYAILAGVAMLGYASVQHQAIIDKMTELTEDEPRICEWWKRDTAKMVANGPQAR